MLQAQARRLPCRLGSVAELTSRRSPRQLPDRRRRKRSGRTVHQLLARRRSALSGHRPRGHLEPTDEPGGMLLSGRFFQRLLSWTKPYSPVQRGTREYERYDWNKPPRRGAAATRSLMPDLMDGTSYFPVPARDAAQPGASSRTRRPTFRSATAAAGRPRGGPDGDRFVLEMTRWRISLPIRSSLRSGSRNPRRPNTPGIELTAHYGETRPAETYAGKRVFLIGKQNSGFELASGLLPWARQIVLASPRPATLSGHTRIPSQASGPLPPAVRRSRDRGRRPASNASIDQIEAGRGRPPRPSPAHRGRKRAGRRGRRGHRGDGIHVPPLQDLPRPRRDDLRPEPVARPDGVVGERVRVPGHLFRGHDRPTAARGPEEARPAGQFRGAVHGARYNARTLARRVARVHFGVEAGPARRRRRRPAADAPCRADARPRGVWRKRSYLARTVGVDAHGLIRDEGIEPLSHYLDDTAGADGLAATLETDSTGAIYPCIHLRTSGQVEERLMTPHPLLDYETPTQAAGGDPGRAFCRHTDPSTHQRVSRPGATEPGPQHLLGARWRGKARLRDDGRADRPGTPTASTSSA